MTTSGTTAWSLTARDVITGAIRDELGVYGFGDEIPADDLAFGMFQLNALMKTLGGSQHLETQGTLTIPGGDSSGALSVDVGEVISARHSSTFERPLVRFERDEYFSLPNKDASGDPTAFFVSNQLGSVVMYVWPVPVLDATIKVDYRRRIETVTDANETIDVPEEYLGMLVANLAARVAGRYGIVPGQRPELFKRAADLLRDYEDAQRPASYMLGPY